MNIKDLIYGSDHTQGIVAIEHKDDMVEVFRESGQNERLKVPYYLVSELEGGQKLDGNLPLKYLQKFETREELDRARRRCRYSGVEHLSIWDDREAVLISSGMTFFKGLAPADVSTLSFDIEATGLVHDASSKILLISNTFKKRGQVKRKLFAYDDYSSEGEFLKAWCNWVMEVDPSIIVGHNIYSYDLPYMDYCARRAGVDLSLGRDGSALRFNDYESKFRRDGSQFYSYRMAHIYGRSIVDTFFLSIKYDVGRKYNSYSLKPLINTEGLEVKDRVFYDASTIRDNYRIPTEWEKIKQYAIHDADDSLALYQLMIPAFFYLARSVPKTFQTIMAGAAGSQINSILLRAYVQAGHSLPLPSETVPFEGAISIGNPGVYENVFKVDISSLYPSVMLEYQVYNKEKDPLGYFYQLFDYLVKERLENKKRAKETGDRAYKDIEGAQKIIINSGAYGLQATPGLNFNSPEHAAEITRKGREILNKAINWVLERNYKLVNADTDSISITNGESWNQVDRRNFLVRLNSLYPLRISWEDDGVYEKVLVIAAKNYALYDGKKLTIKGASLKCSNKEPALKEFAHNIIKELMGL